MKKILPIILSVVFVVSLCISASATLVKEDNVTYWYGWVKDGTEVKEGEVKINADGIVADMTSGNWEIKPQDAQSKITDTYFSPATVWTKDTTKEFDLVWEVNGGKVEIGFLHCVGANITEGTLATVERDGSDLGDYVKLQYSVDGKVWLDCEDVKFAADPERKTPTLISGMTDMDEVITNVGNGTDAYSEDYFIASAELPSTAKYVKFVYAARERANAWDPCVRDARFTAAKVDDSSTPDSSDSSTPENPDSGDISAIFAVIAAVALLGTIVVVKRNRG